MTTYQNAVDYAKNQMDINGITASEANVMIVQMVGFVVVKNSLPRDVRRAYMQAVKEGKLGRLKKDGEKPEIFHHVNAKPRALAERARIQREYNAIKASIFVHAKDI